MKKIPYSGTIPVPKDPLGGVRIILDTAKEWHRISETEKTKRCQISAERDISIAKIAAAKEFFLEFIEKNFQERHRVYDELFSRLDRGLELGDDALIAGVLNGIVAQIQTNPFPSFQSFKENIQIGNAFEF